MRENRFSHVLAVTSWYLRTFAHIHAEWCLFSEKSIHLRKISMIDILYKLTHEGVFKKLAFCIEPLIKRFICYLNLVSFMLNLIWEKRCKLIMKLPYSKTGFTIKLPVLIWNLLAQRNSLIPLLNLAKLKTK